MIKQIEIKDKNLNMRISGETYQSLKRYCAANNVSVSKLLSNYIKAELKKSEISEDK